MPPTQEAQTEADARLFGRGIIRTNGDWRILQGRRIKTGVGQDLLRTRLENRLLSGRNGWYHRPRKGIGLREFQGKPITQQIRREIFNRLESFTEDPSVLRVKDKEVAVKTDPVGRRYTSISCTIITTEGELRFTDRDAFEIGT